MKHPELARTFEAIAEGGHDGYYKGRIAQGQSSTRRPLLLMDQRSST
jgi:gamma-glutamyltranspeptidase